jgi:cell wall-associated NlpC family hydrolase
MDGIAGVQARILEIQQRFQPATTAPLGSAVATMGSASDFAALLEQAKDTADATTTTSVSASGTRTQAFLDAALRQAGDPYVWGAQTSPTDPDPDAFDCSELTKWATQQVGIQIPDGSWLQYLELKQQGALIPVEQALRTPGALLFSFSEEPRPGGGRPSQAHVAISLGDGRTIEARGREYGVGTFDAGDRFEYGAIIPGL